MRTDDGSKEEKRTRETRPEARARGDAGGARRGRRYPARARRSGAFEPAPRAPIRAGRRATMATTTVISISERRDSTAVSGVPSLEFEKRR